MTDLMQNLPYTADSAGLYLALRHLPWPVLLESGTEYLPQHRYDILTADPYLKVVARGAETEVTGRHERHTSKAGPLELIHGYLAGAARPEFAASLPFVGGALGYVGYDHGRRYERFGGTAVKDIEFPDVALGLYDWAVIVDHLEQRCVLVGCGNDPQTRSRWKELTATLMHAANACPEAPMRPLQLTSALHSNLADGAYEAAFNRVKAHISAGDCYQINLTRRFEATVIGDGWSAYRALRQASPAPYAAFLDYPFGQVLSSSPEQFIEVRDGLARTKPIKGTRPRGATAEADGQLAEELRRSSKDRAENVMIVDLLRNDFGRICRPGSVFATKLFDIESFANVHHLVSTVEGELPGNADAIDLFRACFPGGSITGAPKIRSMQIIDEIEPSQRNIYCGAIAYFGFDGSMDSSIVIRTVLLAGGRVYAWAGGGIVADSAVGSEYQESLDKARAMLNVLSAGISA